jgi:hypothetical protein
MLLRALLAGGVEFMLERVGILDVLGDVLFRRENKE